MERIVADLVRLVDQGRFETHVLGLHYLGRFSEGLEEFATFHVGGHISRLSMVWPRSLIEQIRRIGPDVVHSHSGVWYKSTLAARAAGVPRVIHTDHGRTFPVAGTDRFFDSLSARRTDVLVAVSHALSRDLITSNRRLERITEVVVNGVDTDTHSPHTDSGKIRTELGLGRDVPLLGSIGRLERVKGYDLVIEALAIIRSGWDLPTPPPQLVVAGDGKERLALEARAEACGLAHAVHVLSWRDDIRDLHSCFTLFTMASRSEGTSMSLLEAMSAGLCPIVTRVGGNESVLGPALSHRLVPPEDASLLAEAWRDALIDPERMRSDAAEARRRVIEAFAVMRMVREYERLYIEAGTVPASRPPGGQSSRQS